MSTPVIYTKLSKEKRTNFSGGKKVDLFKNYGKHRITGYLLECTKKFTYESWADLKSENVCLIEKGSGWVELGDQKYELKKGCAVKILPGQTPTFIPNKSIQIFSVQMPSKLKKSQYKGEDLSELKIVDSNKVPSMVYEYESLAQEIFTPEYKNSMGLLIFTFSIDKIPMHIHPMSDRIIRTISGHGYTYAQPDIYEMNADTFSAFPKGTIHTNGPIPGHVYRVYAFQIPWVASNIDHKDIAGAPEFVKYCGAVPPKALWKTKPDFMRVIKRITKKMLFIKHL